MLGWRLFRRDWRSGELGVPFTALVLAVAIVSTLGLFIDRLQRAVEQRGATLIAGDLVLRSTRAIDPLWLGAAHADGLRSASTLEFVTMIMSGDAMQLTSVKAVDAAYPLLGEVTVDTDGAGTSHELQHGPARGEAWADERLLGALGIGVGETIVVGDHELRVGAVLLREPDGAANPIVLGPRLMMSMQDVDATGVIQPGSRLQYSYLFAGDRERIAAWRSTIEPRLQPGQRFVTARDGPARIASALSRAETFLLLGGSLGVVLAGAALAMALHRYAVRHTVHVVVLKALGLTTSVIRRMYALNMIGLLLPGILCGWLLGWLLQATAFQLLHGVLAELPPAPGLRALWLGAATGTLGLAGLAMPPLLAMSAASPVGVLRQESVPRAAPLVLHMSALLTLVVLLRWYSGDWKLTAGVLGALLGIVALVGGGSALALRRLHIAGVGAWGALGLALTGLRRHAALNALQVLVITVALMLALVLALLRLALIDDWQRGIDPQAPNYFLLNVAPHQVEGVAAFLKARGVSAAGMYPMVPGRLVSVDGAPPHVREGEVLDLDRELNLSWADAPPPGNVLVAGAWWGQDAGDEVSVESGFAHKLGLHPGSVLTLQVGARRFDAQVSSIRELDWDSMRPNFFLLFPRRLLEREAAMWLTSFHIDRAHAAVPLALVRAYPTVTVIGIDALLAQVRAITVQLTQAISLVFALLLVAALVVLVASMHAGFDARLHEAAILRVLGASRRLVLGSVVIEFGLLGGLAGVLAATGAEAVVWLVQEQVMNLAFHPHPLVWLGGPLLGAVLSALLGLLGCRAVVRTPPLVVLRTVA